jgi:hypothetical protein
MSAEDAAGLGEKAEIPTLGFSFDHILAFNRTKEQCSLINNIVSFSATPLEYC